MLTWFYKRFYKFFSLHWIKIKILVVCVIMILILYGYDKIIRHVKLEEIKQMVIRLNKNDWTLHIDVDINQLFYLIDKIVDKTIVDSCKIGEGHRYL